MDRRGAKDALFEAIAVMGKALSSPVRLELLDLLAQAPRTVDELARASGQSTANASQHLQALHGAGLLTRVREGNRIRYALAGDDALRLWLALREASAAPSSSGAWRTATSSSSTSAPKRNSPPGTSRAPARSPSKSSSAGSPNYR